MRIPLAWLATLAVVALVSAFAPWVKTTAAPAPAHVVQYEAGDVIYVHVTYYYPTGNPTSSGVYPYFGSAGCSKGAFPRLGTTLMFESGLTVKCIDRGEDAFMDPHVDIFCPSVTFGCDSFPGVDSWLQLIPVTVITP